jgi:hypothetical protein
VEEVTYAALSVRDGTFFLLDGFDDAVVPSRHTLSANALLMEGVRRMDEMHYFREKIPSDEHVPVRSDSSSPVSDEYTKTFEAVDGQATVGEIGRRTGNGGFETTKQLFALMQSKHIAIQPPRVTGGLRAVVELANTALRAVFRRVSELGRVQAVQENLDSFIVGGGVYQILFRGAGPHEDGSLDASVVASNAQSLGPDADPERTLKQMMHEYVSFALFSAGAVMPPDVEASMKKEVAGLLEALRTPG